MESTTDRTPVRPIKTVAPYVGGKRNLSTRLVDMIEATPHSRYAEAFVGMGGVFLRRRTKPKFEVINDWSADVANLFRILREHYPQFMEVLRFQITTRAEFDRLSKVDPDTLTDLQRAARFLYLQRLAFGGRVGTRHFGMDMNRARFNLSTLEPMLEDLHERLNGVVIERLPFDRFIERYDSPETLFFLDPPYWGNEADYGKDLFGRADFTLLRDRLEAVQGRFILTINDRPETRALFAGQAFHIEPVGVTYRLSGAPTEARELIITSKTCSSQGDSR
ncbi:DNA adenine methylase [Brevundimonas vitis]|uniref:site-specific DNA-methyltransferase (adenine-specific) n=1 Tax=Brevundimonas vitisensis TaxID=2800818 RepID=A0ABX7BQD3_9CAUL|nr:DNA adenine methylase [Brevundimonas vitisensis]QQQ19660.1 DNA adenine methylase [Brevundimonas vitisensis]